MQPCREVGVVQQRRLFEASPASAKQVAKALLVILAIVQVVCVCVRESFDSALWLHLLLLGAMVYCKVMLQQTN